MGPKFKLTAHQQREAIKRRDTKGEPVREIARTYNVSHSTISRLQHERHHPASYRPREGSLLKGFSTQSHGR
jgi:IS30 family transposase